MKYLIYLAMLNMWWEGPDYHKTSIKEAQIYDDKNKEDKKYLDQINHRINKDKYHPYAIIPLTSLKKVQKVADKKRLEYLEKQIAEIENRSNKKIEELQKEINTLNIEQQTLSKFDLLDI